MLNPNEILKQIPDIIQIFDQLGNEIYNNKPGIIAELTAVKPDVFNDFSGNYYLLKEMSETIDGKVCQIRHYQEITSLYHKINELKIDAVTNLPNRMVVNRKLETLTENCCLALIDIDHFKNVNDTNGHQYGDYILRQLSSSLRSSIHGRDFIGRYGGEEFLIILKNDNLEFCLSRFNQLRKQTETAFQDEKTKITISIGVSKYEIGDNIVSKIAEADNCLYYVKTNGRNNVAYFDKENTCLSLYEESQYQKTKKQ